MVINPKAIGQTSFEYQCNQQHCKAIRFDQYFFGQSKHPDQYPYSIINLIPHFPVTDIHIHQMRLKQNLYFQGRSLDRAFDFKRDSSIQIIQNLCFSIIANWLMAIFELYF